MKKGKAKRNGWFYVAIGALLVSMLSLFTPIITYTEGTKPISFSRILGLNVGSGSSYASFKTYNIIDLLKGDSLVKEVLTFYRGEVFWRIDTPEIIAMALLVIASLTASLVGICTMRSQYHRRWQFIMTLAGLIGTAFPSLVIFYAVNQSQKGFSGVIQCGIAPVIMPVAALISIIAVVYRRSSVQKEIRQRAKAENLIWAAGDLSRPKQQSGYSGRYR